MTLALDPTVGVDVAADAVARAMRAGAHGAKVLHRFKDRFEIGFDTDDVTLVRSTVADDVSITVYVDGSRGSIELSGRAHDALDRAVAQAVEAARGGEPDPANVLPEEPGEPAADRGDEQPDRGAMLDVVLRHIERMKAQFPTIRCRDSAHYSFECDWTAYANSHGRVQHARHGTYTVAIMAAAKDGRRTTSFDGAGVVSLSPFGDLTSIPAVEKVLADLLASFDARPVPSTFVGDVIVKPSAMADLVATIAGALSGLALMRRTTPFLDALGTPVADASFSLLHRPSRLAGASPFDGEGFVNRDLDVIRDGVLTNFLVDWYTSNKLNRPMTTGCADFVVPPGDIALDDLIAGTERGILLGRYSGAMPNQALDFSGVAKNSFYIEDGKVVGPLAETMIAGNFRSVLEQIKGVSREYIDYGEDAFPWLATSGVTISTK